MFVFIYDKNCISLHLLSSKKVLIATLSLYILIERLYHNLIFIFLACSLNHTACDNGHCLPDVLWCNHVDDCEDASDERYCGFDGGFNFGYAITKLSIFSLALFVTHAKHLFGDITCY